MSLSPIGSAVFELLSRKHTYRQTDIHHITLEYRFHIYFNFTWILYLYCSSLECPGVKNY